MKSSPSRREVLQRAVQAASCALPARAASAAIWGKKKKKQPRLNVLFIAVDDLRPLLGCYGHRDVFTPHIDALASQGLTFTRAYCQQAAGSPSRTSLLTGLRPDSTRVGGRKTHFRRYRPRAVTLPQYFKQHDYVTASFSKIFDNPRLDDLPSWSAPSWIPGLHSWNSRESRVFAAGQWERLRRAGWLSEDAFSYDPAMRTARPGGEDRPARPSWEILKVSGDSLPDGMTAGAVIEVLERWRDRRFFLAAGFLKPHLPFAVPEKYYDLYPESQIKLPEFTRSPADSPPFALHDSEELRAYGGIPQQGPVGDRLARQLIRGYRASVSYVDAQIGRVLGALDALGLRERTTVVLWGDHGYHLGDHGLWGKHSNLEAATRVPLIVSAPGQPSRGKSTAALTELVDIYPSLCELCGLPRPAGLEGSDFTPLLRDPDRLWKRAVFSQYPRQITGVGPGMGRSMRTARYRYTEWRADDSPYTSAELYDYKDDPLETVNLAGHRGNVSLVNGLSGMLRDGWRSSLPPPEGPA